MSQWNDFPHDPTEYTYAGDSLKTHWSDLHRGDCVMLPDAAQLEALASAADVAPPGFDGDFEALARRLRQAWRHYHCGEFQQAVELADTCGPVGHAAANKATGIYATYLEDDDATKADLFEAMIERAQQAMELMPDDANAHYFYAFALGRKSQNISVAKALKQGVGGKVKDALSATLERAPEHAEAQTAMGLYHAEIIDKVGKLIGGMTYGASADEAMAHFQKALELTPEAPIAHIEYGNGLYLLYGDKRIDEVTDAYISASELSPRNAMEKLDIESALAELE